MKAKLTREKNFRQAAKQKFQGANAEWEIIGGPFKDLLPNKAKLARENNFSSKQ